MPASGIWSLTQAYTFLIELVFSFRIISKFMSPTGNSKPCSKTTLPSDLISKLKHKTINLTQLAGSYLEGFLKCYGLVPTISVGSSTGRQNLSLSILGQFLRFFMTKNPFRNSTISELLWQLLEIENRNATWSYVFLVSEISQKTVTSVDTGIS